MEQESEPIEVEEVIIEYSDSLEDHSRQQDVQLKGNEPGQDELLPRAVFQIEEDNENLTEEEKQAFSYIRAVRTQKQEIVSQRKHNIQIQIQIGPVSNNKPEDKINSDKAAMVWKKTSTWRQQLINNWRIIIANMQYVCKNSQQFHKKKVTAMCLKQPPLIDSLCLNRWLQVPHIEQLLVILANSRIQALNFKKIEDYDNYHIWIYNLLALHQSYASYSNFEALASLNASLTAEKQCLQEDINRSTTQDEKGLIKKKLLSWAITAVLLIEIFHQKCFQSDLNILSSIL